MTQEATSVCADCGEPVELYEPNDPDSWIHRADADYWGDHTAWVESLGSASCPQSTIGEHCLFLSDASS